MGSAEEQTGLCRIICGCLFGKGLEAPGGEGKGDKCILFVSALPFGPELLSSWPAVITVVVPQGMARIWGQTPAVAQDKLQ